MVLVIFEIRRKRKLRNQNNLDKSISNTVRGGADVDLSPEILKECLEREGAYKIVGYHLKTAIRKILNNRNSKQTLVVDRAVVLIASIIVSDLASQLTTASVDFLIEKIKTKAAIVGVTILGLVGATTVFSLAGSVPIAWRLVVQILGGTLSAAGVFYGQYRMPLCNQHVLYLPKMGPSAYYIDLPEINADRISMVSDKQIELFVEKQSKDEFRYVTVLGEEKGFLGGRDKEIKKDCFTKQVYGPLKRRTKTINDVKEGDSTKNLEKARNLGLSKKDSKAIAERIRN